jgi:hypothetical protein
LQGETRRKITIECFHRTFFNINNGDIAVTQELNVGLSFGITKRRFKS